jgi:hypothetical protein
MHIVDLNRLLGFVCHVNTDNIGPNVAVLFSVSMPILLGYLESVHQVWKDQEFLPVELNGHPLALSAL